jgi:Fur family ferric uptake transcriptional regulator
MRSSSVDQIILETLSTEKSHLTTLQLFDVLRERLPAVNQSTVYRALERLTHSGKVSVSDIGTGSAVYELLTNGLHHHLICQKCGLVSTLEDIEVRRFFDDLEQKSRFQITTNHLILFGICENCRVKDAV